TGKIAPKDVAADWA
ncbi:hypothetical protein R6H99_15075, partial [Escherichia coli]